MKYLKVLGLGLLAAAALMAFIGTGTASATVLCSTTSTPCNGVYKATTKWDASLIGKAIIEKTDGTKLSECQEGTFNGEISKAGNAKETVLLGVGGLTWGKCSIPTETVTWGELEVHAIAGTDNGTVTATKTEVTIWLSGADCIYGAGEGVHFGTLTGSFTDPILDVNATLPRTFGGILVPPALSGQPNIHSKNPHLSS